MILPHKPKESTFFLYILTCRVPFRHIVVGLLSNQLLLQTVGTILLGPGLTKITEDSNEKESKLPGEYVTEIDLMLPRNNQIFSFLKLVGF